jgi:phage replication O-like protein O
MPSACTTTLNNENIVTEQNGYTRTPNSILDRMACMKEVELRVVLAVIRKTTGYQKERDRISLSQFEDMTGLSRQGVLDGITLAIEHGHITRTPDRQWFVYQVVNTVDRFNHKGVNGVDQFESPSSQHSRPEVVNTVDHLPPKVVNTVDTQKKDSKEKKKRESERGDQNSPARTPAVLAYFETYPETTLSAAQVQEINERVTNMARWKLVLREWELNGWQAKSIGKMLNRYDNGITIADERPAQQNGHKPARPPADMPLTVADPNKRIRSAEERRRILNEVKVNDTS